MVEDLVRARDVANKMRFSGDVISQNLGGEFGLVARLREHWYQHAIEICPELTPTLWARLSLVCSRLHMPNNAVTAFIYSSPEIQAECIGGRERCLVRVSSSTIDLLTEDEFEFVLGHELGHFLLDHRRIGEELAAPEAYFNMRSQEISADRIGLIACKSLDVALRALMKTISGLTERHLRFDVAAFVSQLRKIETSDFEGPQSTHPSTIIRSKALLWFSLSDAFSSGIAGTSQSGLAQINARVEQDLQRYIDGSAKRRIDHAKNDLLLWMITYEIVQIGTLSKFAQETMASIFSQDTIECLRLFVSSLNRKELDAVVYAKLIEARDCLEKLIPISFLSEMTLLRAVADEQVAKLKF